MPDFREPQGEGISAMQAMLRDLEYLAFRGMQGLRMVARTELSDRQQIYGWMRDMRDSSPFSVPSDDLLTAMDSAEQRRAAAARIFPQVQENFWAPGVIAFRSTRQPHLIVDEWFDRAGGITRRVTTEISDRHSSGGWQEVITEEWFTEVRSFDSLQNPYRAVTRRETRVEQHGSSTEPHRQYRQLQSLQHWEIHLGNPGVCYVNVGRAVLTFPLVEFSISTGGGGDLIKFTVPAAQLSARPISCLRLQEGNIFGEIVEYFRHNDQEEDVIDFTLRLHPESFQMSARRGEAVRYTFDVPIARYRQNLRPEELLNVPVQQERVVYSREQEGLRDRLGSYYERLEHAGLLPDRAEALQELMQERSQPPIKQPHLCGGCRNLHGQYHGGNLLICAMHPYGNGENCSDFEAK